MTFYELHRFVDDRWLLEAIFPQKAEAIEEAKALMTRARRVVAVRVLKVEEQGAGFAEWLVYHQSTAEEVESTATRRRRRRLSRRLRALPRTVAAKARNLAEGSSPRPPLWLVAGILSIGAAVILFTHRPLHPNADWVFDRPEAQLPHSVRNPLTGAVSN